MKALLALAPLLLASAVVFAADEDEGFVPIFDGKTMEGWKINESPDSWSIEEGAFKANGERSHLFYVGDLAPLDDFELKLDVMTRKNSNGGVFIHTAFQDEGWPKQGYEVQVNNTFERDPQKTGGLYNTVRVEKAPAEDDKWFTMHIAVAGRHVTIKVDGKTVVDYTEPEDKEGPLKLSKGTVALQAHDPGSTVYFKNIRVKKN